MIIGLQSTVRRIRPDRIFAWGLALLWIFPLLYVFWAAFHGNEHIVRFNLFAPKTLVNFFKAWEVAPFPRYMLNTVLLVVSLLCCQFLVCSLAAFSFARFRFPGKDIVFGFVLVQLLVTPEILMVRNYVTISALRLVDSIPGIFLPYVASAFGIFLLRQAFKTVPLELEEAAIIDGCGWFRLLLHVFIPLSKASYLAYGLVSISHHWNDFLWPLIVTNTVRSRTLTVGLSIFAAPESGVDWAVLSAGTLLAIFPLLSIFLVFQKQFADSFSRSGIR